MEKIGYLFYLIQQGVLAGLSIAVLLCILFLALSFLYGVTLGIILRVRRYYYDRLPSR